jgi:hypothetical protein
VRDELQLHFEAAAIRQRRRIFRAPEEQMRKDGVARSIRVHVAHCATIKKKHPQDFEKH